MYLYRLVALNSLSLLFGAQTGRCQSSKSTNTPTALATSFPDPNIDPFYTAPSNISSFAPGQVIRSRRVSTTVTGPFAESYQAFYRTTDNQDNPIGSVATIWVPGTPANPPKLLSFPQAEDALNLDCAPSWAWVNRSSTLETFYSFTSFPIPWALANGYYVVVGDAEGPNSTWLVGRTEGRATLDGIRATINHLDLTSPAPDVAMLSYSGGAHATVWASSLADAYAPELRIVGAAYGGTPVDLLTTYNLLNGGSQALLAFGAVIGLANGYPQLNRSLTALLTANGSAAVAKIRAPNYCLNTQMPSEFANRNISTAFTRSNIFDIPGVSGVLARESLLSNVSSVPVPVPKFPRFQFHGTADTTVPFAPEAAYVQQQCDKGADIRFVPLPGLDHAPALFFGLPGALLFINQAFHGTLANVTCGSNVTLPSIQNAEQELGVNLTTFLAGGPLLQSAV